MTLPSTGDDFNAGVWVAAMMLSMLSCAALLAWKKGMFSVLTEHVK